MIFFVPHSFSRPSDLPWGLPLSLLSKVINLLRRCPSYQFFLSFYQNNSLDYCSDCFSCHTMVQPSELSLNVIPYWYYLKIHCNFHRIMFVFSLMFFCFRILPFHLNDNGDVLQTVQHSIQCEFLVQNNLRNDYDSIVGIMYNENL